jgi:phage tail sheath protein FI
LTRDLDVGRQTWDAATAFAKRERALVIVDPPSAWDEPDDVTGAAGLDTVITRDENAAIYFPRVWMPDPLRENRLESFAPCGIIAGIYARTDVQRGVWKAPAGIEAVLIGVFELTANLTDGENGRLNPIGVNCLRGFPVVGRVVWGARTLRGADQLASEWKYVPVRRTALFLEESLYRGTQWVVFEPNDEPLWAQIRLNVGAFMQNLFRQGAFQGSSPREAYFVKCDRETTTQNDISLGIVNILVGFAPLKPAEFVVIKIQQMAGQVEV